MLKGTRRSETNLFLFLADANPAILWLGNLHDLSSGEEPGHLAHSYPGNSWQTFWNGSASGMNKLTI